MHSAIAEFTMPSGRVLRVGSLALSLTYSGHMEGSYESVSNHVLKSIRKKEKGARIAILESTFPLPSVQCEAWLRSDEDGDLESKLKVYWWLDAMPDSVQAALQPLGAIDWAAMAETYDPFDF